jgi:hypothetical protein
MLRQVRGGRTPAMGTARGRSHGTPIAGRRTDGSRCPGSNRVLPMSDGRSVSAQLRSADDRGDRPLGNLVDRRVQDTAGSLHNPVRSWLDRDPCRRHRRSGRGLRNVLCGRCGKRVRLSQRSLRDARVCQSSSPSGPVDNNPSGAFSHPPRAVLFVPARRLLVHDVVKKLYPCGS